MSQTIRFDPQEASEQAELAFSSRSETAQDGRAPYPRVRTFARRGDRMSDTLERTFEKYKSAYLLDLERGAGVTMAAPQARLDPRVVFGREAPLIVEVGCGNGEQIVHAAANHPENNYLGFEVWLPGVAKIVSSAVRNFDGLANLKVADVDALQALPILFAPGGGETTGGVRENSDPRPDANAKSASESRCGVINELWTFFADPWPKNRHKKRRLVAPKFAEIAADLLVDGGLWRMATDWADYAWQMRDVIESTPGLVNVYAGQRPDPEDPEGRRGGFAPRFEGRIVTAFERRARRENREVRDLCAQRVARETTAEPRRAGTVS